MVFPYTEPEFVNKEKSKMFSEMMDDLDDFLIDRVFQPMCDRIRKTFGWSKRVPAAISDILSAVGLIPLTAWLIFFGIGRPRFSPAYRSSISSPDPGWPIGF